MIDKWDVLRLDLLAASVGWRFSHPEDDLIVVGDQYIYGPGHEVFQSKDTDQSTTEGWYYVKLIQYAWDDEKKTWSLEKTELVDSGWAQIDEIISDVLEETTEQIISNIEKRVIQAQKEAGEAK